MNIPVSLDENEARIAKKYADINNISLEEFIKIAVIEKIENKYDLACYEKAMEEYKKNPKTYTLKEIYDK